MRLEDARPPDVEGRLTALVYVLHRLWTYAMTTKADEARVYADEIAEAASRGFITTQVTPGGDVYGRLWKLTPSGTAFLYDHPTLLSDQDNDYVSAHSRV